MENLVEFQFESIDWGRHTCRKSRQPRSFYQLRQRLLASLSHLPHVVPFCCDYFCWRLGPEWLSSSEILLSSKQHPVKSCTIKDFVETHSLTIFRQIATAFYKMFRNEKLIKIPVKSHGHVIWQKILIGGFLHLHIFFHKIKAAVFLKNIIIHHIYW